MLFEDLFNNDPFMLGMNILANNTGHYGAAAPAIGGGARDWATQKGAMLEAAEKQQQMQHLDQFLKTLPQEQQDLFKAYPNLAEDYFSEKFGLGGDRFGSYYYAKNPDDNNNFWIYQFRKGGNPIPIQRADPKWQSHNFGTHIGYTQPFDPTAPVAIPGQNQPPPGQMPATGAPPSMGTFSPQGAPEIAPGQVNMPPIGTPQPGNPPQMPAAGPVNIGSNVPRTSQYGSAAINPPPESDPDYRYRQKQAEMRATRESEDAANRGKAQANLQGAERRVSTVEDIIDRLEIDANSGTGFMGSVASINPWSDSSRLRANLDALGAMISFETLGDMRQSSPTGGALGNVTERELELLKATMGSLDPRYPDQFYDNITRIRQQFRDIVHGTRERYIEKYGPVDGAQRWDSVWGAPQEAKTGMTGDDFQKRLEEANTQEELDDLLRMLEEGGM